MMNNKICAERISHWIKQQVKQAFAKGIILGLSGGVDSAVVAVLSKKAAGNNLLCLIMPCNSLKQDLQDARLLAEKFNLKTRLINIEPVFNAFVKILPKGDKKAHGNLKARLRMATLYYFANKFNYLVVGTGNKSELYAGYFTKYGDAGVDILPIADLLKTDVWRIAGYLGIPKGIIEKAPSAGLWLGQTDEGELGITYRQLDKVLSEINNKAKQRLNPETRKVKKLIYKSEHKRQCPRIFYLDK